MAGGAAPPESGYLGKPANLRALTVAAGHGVLRQVTWRRRIRTSTINPQAKVRSRFMAIRVRPEGHHIPRAS